MVYICCNLPLWYRCGNIYPCGLDVEIFTPEQLLVWLKEGKGRIYVETVSVIQRNIKDFFSPLRNRGEKWEFHEQRPSFNIDLKCVFRACLLI